METSSHMVLKQAKKFVGSEELKTQNQGTDESKNVKEK